MDGIQEANAVVDLVITKASLGSDGVMRWTATVSKFAADDQDDEVTPQFFKSAIKKVESGVYPMPALVVSHYDDPRPEVKTMPVPAEFKVGETLAIYVDGDQPKAKGIFLDTPMGRASFSSVRRDIENDIPQKQRIRISMAFRPDNGGVFKSDTGISRYFEGSIRHFALTRVPIVEETKIMAEKSEAVVEKSSPMLRIQDAASIVGDELAQQLDQNYNSIMKNKSESDLREKSADADAPPASQEVEEAAPSAMVVEPASTEAVEEVAEKSEVIADAPVIEGTVEPSTLIIAGEARPELEHVEITKHEAPVTEEPVTEKADMGDTKHNNGIGTCISAKLQEGWDRKKAIAACLNMSKEKADYHEDEVFDGFNPSDCAQEYVAKGYSASVARSICEAQMHKAALMLLEQNEEYQALEEKSRNYLSMPLDECVKACMANGESEAEARAKCSSERAMAMRETMKSATLDDVLSVAISDSEVQVVKSMEAVAEVAEPEPASESAPVTSPSDVNTPSESVGSDTVDQLANLFKSVLEDGTMPTDSRVATANYVLSKLSGLARTAVVEQPPQTPAQPSKEVTEQADIVKAALDGAVAPLLVQVEQLTNLMLELQQENLSYKALLTKGSRPKQLSYGESAVLEKSNAAPPGGPMSADQIASYTVRSGHMY